MNMNYFYRNIKRFKMRLTIWNIILYLILVWFLKHQFFLLRYVCCFSWGNSSDAL